MQIIPFVCMLLIIIIGLIFNTAAILSICFNSNRFSLKNQLILSLCISNVIQDLIPFTMELEALYVENINGIICSMESFLICLCTYSAIAHFIILSFERYISIVAPYKARRWFRRRWVKSLLLFLCWIYGLILSIPPLIGWSSYRKTHPDSTYCCLSFEDKSVSVKIYFFLLIVLNFAIPITMTVVIYALIIRDLKKTVDTVTRQNGRGSIVSRCSQRNVRTQVIILLLTIFIYVFSWMPLAIVCCMFYYDVPVSRLTEYFVIYMSKSSTVSSPIVFCLLERQFWNFMREAFTVKQRE